MTQPAFYAPTGVVSSLRMDYGGTYSLAGVTKVAGAPAPCRVYLHRESDGLCVGYRRSDSYGVYSFTNVAGGNYYLVILDDRQNTRRAKVEHVTV